MNIRIGAVPLFAIIAVAIAVYAVGFASSYDLRVLTVSGIYVIVVLGYQFIFGYAGALSLAQGAFFGIGAYVTGILGSQFGWQFTATFPLSILVPALLAATIALPVLRLQSHYFALATLALGQGILLIAINWEGVTGGANGLPGVPGIVIFDIAIPRGLALLAFVWGLAAAAAALAWWIMHGLYGLSFTVMRETPLAADALGIDRAALRFVAFVLSAAYGGAAGALFVHTIRVISPEVLGFAIMVTVLTMTVIGGRTQIVGAVIGAILLIHLPEWFRGLEEYYLVAMGVVLLLVILFAPDGAAAYFGRRPTKAEDKSRPDIVPIDLRPGRKAGFEIKGLTKSYGGNRALDGVDLTVAPGEIVGLIGPNGSGKTTLANLLTGLDRPDGGRITLEGEDITGLPAHRIARLGIGRTFQTPQLAPSLSLVDAVAAAHAGNRNSDLTTAREDAFALLAGFDLTARADQLCRSQPHGVKRSVDLAAALARRPSIIVLDEPAAGLTQDEAATLAGVVRTYAANGAAVLVIDHDMTFLLPLAQRLVCLDAGQVIAHGLPDEVVEEAAVIAAYFGAPVISPASAP
ncbi:MAG: branched-chain amino acid ABC transporter ATP-binding protein/permease [Alphaproteobacteria bacterium]|nr:branched-chain amino acid ABC transporter ATP-binding protein/permease [Alphaproteobacteria bacterium]